MRTLRLLAERRHVLGDELGVHAEGFHRPAERGNDLRELPAKMGGEEGVLGIPADDALGDDGGGVERAVGEGEHVGKRRDICTPCSARRLTAQSWKAGVRRP